MNLKWVDVQEIAILLNARNPDLNPYSINFVVLRDMVMSLSEFEDEKNRSSEKILEAIQIAWQEEHD
ncbi:Fe-S cluster assembly protein IscX [Candidatus Pseudomonas adelgestsugas]|uniref:FeS assembly protein IscX n=1 Tax=Candidatus Pseudomonas adelgestsugas TaxID=1302376 RepID=A0ABX5RAE3_9PSED|nr:Fe-S cluster assembly protein IscX [Candidatus Pseudomonas adelgestsugas]QAX82259.1 FeS assembly protein IscX [Candidatus Pseudomonas adelgestsugas]